MKSFEILLTYNNRQVMVNGFQGDELLERDGFTFEWIVLGSGHVRFVRGGRVVKELNPAADAELVQQPVFPRFYAFEQNGTRTELYFP